MQTNPKQTFDKDRISSSVEWSVDPDAVLFDLAAAKAIWEKYQPMFEQYPNISAIIVRDPCEITPLALTDDLDAEILFTETSEEGMPDQHYEAFDFENNDMTWQYEGLMLERNSRVMYDLYTGKHLAGELKVGFTIPA